MQKWLIACLSLMLCVSHSVQAQGSYGDRVRAYVEKYSKLAEEEQVRSGVPAAVTLGQGVLETEAGTSELMTKANNHFGIKCKSDWTGETFAHTDDAPNECFRKYKNAAASYRDHSDYLKTSKRYASLFKLSETNYKGWAYGLKRCGYATNPRYAQQLINIIEDFHLQDYTYAAMNASKAGENIANNEPDNGVQAEPLATTAEKKSIGRDIKEREINKTVPSKIVAGKVMKVNGLHAIYAFKGESLLPYAVKYHIRYQHLLDINDLQDAPLPSNMYVYLERKNTKGTHDIHVVKPGETLLQIAQLEGIQLRRLMMMNHISMMGEQPVVGSVLELQKMADVKPKMAYQDSRVLAQDNAEQQVVDKNDNYINKSEIASESNAATTTPPQEAVTEPATQVTPEVAAKQEPAEPVQQEQEKPAATVVTNNTTEAAKQIVSTEQPAKVVEEVPVNHIAQLAKEATKNESSKKEDAASNDTKDTKSLTPAEQQAYMVTADDSKQEKEPVSEAKGETEATTDKVAASQPAATVPIDDKVLVQEEKPEPEKPTTSTPEPAATNTITKAEIEASDNEHKSDDEHEEEETANTKQETVATNKSMDPLDILKAKMDKVVYADGSKPVTENTDATTENKESAATTPATDTKEPVAAKENKPKAPVVKEKRVRRADGSYVVTQTIQVDSIPKNVVKKYRAADGTKYYTVKKGDTVFGIAKMYKVSMHDLIEWNHLDFNAVKIGQKLRVSK